MMLCRNGIDKDVEAKNLRWLGAKKYDGVRCLAYSDGVTAKLIGRSGADYSSKFPDIVQALNGFVGTLDGEITCGDNFQITQSRTLTDDKLKLKLLLAKYPATFNIFDLIALNGSSLKEMKLAERLQLLKNSLVGNNPTLKIIEHTTDLMALFEIAKAGKWEGIVIKNPDSKYRENFRSPDWLKVKLKKSKDIKFTSFTENPAGVRVEADSGIAIQVSGNENSGKVKSAFQEKGYAIIEVEFLEEFESGNLRQPVFKEMKEELMLLTSTDKFVLNAKC